MFVDEYQELHDKILAGDDAGVLVILSELDEMSLDDKINKIESFMRVLLVHLVKREAEGRTTGVVGQVDQGRLAGDRLDQSPPQGRWPVPGRRRTP